MNFRNHCEEANHICDKSQYKEASLIEKIKLNLHLIYCAACRKYSSRNHKLTQVMKRVRHECQMPEDDKKRLKKRLRQEMKK